jgi:hypothetical protein
VAEKDQSTVMAMLAQPRKISRIRRQLVRRAGALGLAVALGSSMACGAAQRPVDEYQVKAAFLYNFVKFVEWPSDAFQSATENIVICVLGQNPFGRVLEDAVNGHAIDGRSLIVRHFSNVSQMVKCHVLFVSSAGNKPLPQMLPETSGVLTVGESDAPGADGVVINFKLDAGRVRFEINVQAAEREKIRISSRLLSLAEVTGQIGTP